MVLMGASQSEYLILKIIMISRPLPSISESGIYSLDPSLRTAVSHILDNKIFRKKISRIDRFKMKNKPLLGRRPQKG